MNKKRRCIVNNGTRKVVKGERNKQNMEADDTVFYSDLKLTRSLKIATITVEGYPAHLTTSGQENTMTHPEH